MQRVTPGVCDSFEPVEKTLKETLVPALFEGLREGVPEQGSPLLILSRARERISRDRKSVV